MRFRDKILSVMFTIVRIGVMISSVIAVFWFFRWVGWKGFISFVAGMSLMAYVILSKNPLIKWVIDATQSDEYIWELMKK